MTFLRAQNDGSGKLSSERRPVAEGDEKISGISGALFLAREHEALRIQRGLYEGNKVVLHSVIFERMGVHTATSAARGWAVTVMK